MGKAWSAWTSWGLICMYIYIYDYGTVCIPQKKVKRPASWTASIVASRFPFLPELLNPQLRDVFSQRVAGIKTCEHMLENDGSNQIIKSCSNPSRCFWTGIFPSKDSWTLCFIKNIDNNCFPVLYLLQLATAKPHFVSTAPSSALR